MTSRYKIIIEELSEGGPGGYESTYLTSEGSPASEELYEILDGFKGGLLPASARVIRQRNGEALVKALQDGKPVGIASGFKPSGAYHFGHRLASSAVAFFQKNGAQIFMPVADIECDMDTKISREQYRFWAADNLLDWGANGVNLDATHVYLQSEEIRVNTLAYFVARSLKLELAIDIYGIEKMVKDFPFLFAGVTQVGDIILPQHNDFGNYHSFMVSGQDQDGHMKMTVALTEDSLKNGIAQLGVKTIPSGFYIPHIRGISGDKASSSKAEGTLYLGSGPQQEDLDDRIKSTLSKFDAADREQLERCALDMVRFIDVFNRESRVDFTEAAQTQKYKDLVKRLDDASRQEQQEVQAELDGFLISFCQDKGQNNIEIVRDSLPEALREHQKRRKTILEYANERELYFDRLENGLNLLCDTEKPIQPEFWKVPECAVVDQDKRNQTRWFDIVHSAADRIIP